MSFVCCFFCFLPLKSSVLNVVFDFNAPLIDFAPLSPMKQPVKAMRVKEVIVD